MPITITQTGPNAYKLVGTDGNDNFFAIANTSVLDADNIFEGGYGADTIIAGWGNDQAFGGKGDDLILGGVGDDALDGGSGSDWLIGDVGNDRIDGGVGYAQDKDTLEGGAGHDTYVIRDLNDVIVGEENFATAFSRDTIELRIAMIDMTKSASLRAIEDVKAVSAISVNIIGNQLDNAIDASLLGPGASAVVHGGEGKDSITGSSLVDQLFGDAGNDLLIGLDGADFLFGGAGADEMRGGKGGDRYEIDSKNDVVVENANEGYDIADVYASSYVMNANLEEARLHVVGGTITGSEGDNKIIGSAGNDAIMGRGGNDVLIGGAGNDFLSGGTGKNTLEGGTGNDVYFVQLASDVVVESIFSNGVDEIHTTLSSYTLSDTVMVENLMVIGDIDFIGVGNSLNNRIEGNLGDDKLYGKAGNDVLIGRGGHDELWGGSGADRFMFDNSAFNSSSAVRDFQQGVDKIVLDSDGRWSQIAYSDDIVMLRSFNGGGVVTVHGVDYLGAQDIIFI